MPELKLDIERIEGRYRARVRKAPAGKGATSWFDLPAETGFTGDDPDPATLWRHLTIDSPGRQETPRRLGQHLFEKVFTGPVLTAWRASLAASGDGDLLLRLRLDDDPRLLSVPWELLFDPDSGTFLATERRVVRSLGRPMSVRRLAAPAPFRILVVLSCPAGVARLDTRQEWAALDQALGGKVVLKPVPPNLQEIDQALQSGEWHALHFVGHGGTDSEGGFLVLEDGHGDARTVDHLRLGKVLSHPSLRLIVLNACEGARPGQTDVFSGVAQALGRKGVPAVVAMQKPISDAAAIAFARSFYGALAEEWTVGTALWKAREDLFRDHEAEWAIPVLYLSGKDRPVIISDPGPDDGGAWKKVAVALVGLGLVIGLIWQLTASPEPPDDREECRPPQGAENNPKLCPSPKDLNMAFALIEPGTFQMGQKGGAKDDEPVHLVRITQPFCIGVYEVTQEQWAIVFGNQPPKLEERHLPVQRIKYAEAQDFLRRLNEKDPARPYRLPTEAEWEYVARGRMQMAFSFGDAAALVQHANCGESGDGFDGVACVGQFSENPWGVHDMLGNVFEWVSDWYGSYPSEPVDDPRGPQTGEKRIRRGGGWDSAARTCSSVARSDVQPDYSDKYTGFRLVREIR